MAFWGGGDERANPGSKPPATGTVWRFVSCEMVGDVSWSTGGEALSLSGSSLRPPDAELTVFVAAGEGVAVWAPGDAADA